MAEYERSQLRTILSLVAPALLKSNTLATALQHFWFNGKRVEAYNDRFAISAPCVTDFKGGLPGELLALINSTAAKKIELAADGDAVSVKLGSGRASLPLLQYAEYREFFAGFKASPDTEPLGKREALFDAVRLCIKQVGSDTSSPEQLGVSLVPDGDDVMLFATNHVTMAHSRVKRPKGLALPRTVILPSEFCEQMLSLEKGSEVCKLEINDSSAIFQADAFMLFEPLIENPKPLDLLAIMNAYYKDADRKLMVEAPANLGPIIDRAMIMTEGKDESQAVTIKVEDFDGTNNKVRFMSKSSRGVVNDVIKVAKAHPLAKLTCEPKLIRDGIGVYDKVLFTDQCVIMAKEQSIYLILASDQ